MFLVSPAILMAGFVIARRPQADVAILFFNSKLNTQNYLMSFRACPESIGRYSIPVLVKTGIRYSFCLAPPPVGGVMFNPIFGLKSAKGRRGCFSD